LRRSRSIFGVNGYTSSGILDVRATGSLLAGANVVEYRLDVVAEAGSVLFAHCPDFGDNRVSRWLLHRRGP
jgi:hypothetical protein